MSQFVAYKNGKLLVMFDLIGLNYTTAKVPLKYWVTSQGLILPLERESTMFTKILNGNPSGLYFTSSNGRCLLLDLAGDIHYIDGSSKDLTPLGDGYFSRLQPTGDGVHWVLGTINDDCERVGSALELTDDYDKIRELAITSDVSMAKGHHWHAVDDLLKTMLEIHQTKYPTHVRYRKQEQI